MSTANRPPLRVFYRGLSPRATHLRLRPSENGASTAASRQAAHSLGPAAASLVDGHPYGSIRSRHIDALVCRSVRLPECFRCTAFLLKLSWPPRGILNSSGKVTSLRGQLDHAQACQWQR